MRRHRALSWLVVVVLLATLAGTAGATPTRTAPDPVTALVQVLVPTQADLDSFAQTGVPAYARLEGPNGLSFLAGADPAGLEKLAAAGLSVRVLDDDLAGATYYLAYTAPNRPAPDWPRYGRVLLDDGVQVLLRMSPAAADRLVLQGVELRAVTFTAKPVQPGATAMAFPEAVDPDPLLQQMMDDVTQNEIMTYDQQLAGELPVWVDGAWYTITSRYTYSGTPIQKATSFVGQHMADLGLDVEYHTWGGATYPNVIGEITGATNPDDIFIIGGHLDAVQTSPGADDNASGSIAALMAADILSQYEWGCTLRFALWTGEEQGLLGSDVYAERSYQQGENIVGYLNLDMIAYNTIGSSPDIDLIYNSSMAPTHDLALLFADVVDAYDLDLIPQLRTSVSGGSDHSSFWERGYTAILAIEDQGDFNPYYHSPGDTPAHIDQAYFTQFVKASLGTFAHMSGCLIPGGLGALDGHVTAANGGAPVPDATISAVSEDGSTFTATTDGTGYYTRTLLSGTYTVTAEAYGYVPATVTGVPVTTDTVTTQDFSLQTASFYQVSGHVTEAGTGLPLLAEIEIVGSPLTLWTDPADGSYSASLPPGSYTMLVRANRHHSQERDITVTDHDQVQDFSVEPNACILFVDDDQDDPNIQTYWTLALDAADAEYDVWDVAIDGSPSTLDLAGYTMVLWTTGAPSSGTFTGDNESAVAAYLDGGGRFLLASHEYLYEFGRTAFGQNYLGIQSYTSDVQRSDPVGVTGDPIGNGLGPYSLQMPPGWSSNWSDSATGVQGSPFRWQGNSQNNSTRYESAGFQTVFLAWPFEGIANVNDRADVLGRVIDWFGSCTIENGGLVGQVTDAVSGEPLAEAQVIAAPGKAGGPEGLTDPNGYYTFTLPAGVYNVTASKEGYYPYTALGVQVQGGMTTTQDFALEPIVCQPISGLAFDWLPAAPVTGEPVTFTTVATGSEPIDYDWAFGDGTFGGGQSAVHTYAAADDYTVTVTATNVCDQETITATVTVTVCESISGLDLSWSPAVPMAGEVVTLTAVASGTAPILFEWDLGDESSAGGAVVTHTYALGTVYTVTLTATNGCDSETIWRNLLVRQDKFYVYLPIVTK